MLIGGLQKLTLAGCPSELSCAVFLVGCNFHCPWCSVPELVLPERIKNTTLISEKEFFSFLKQKREVLKGVSLEGGEPTVHRDLPEFCRSIKKMGYKVKLATNGSNPVMLQYLIKQGLVDYAAMDVKAPKEKYARAIGLEGDSPHFLLSKIEQSIALLKQGTVDYEFCTTFTPLLQKEDILKIVHWLRPAKRYRLQTFQTENLVDPFFKVVEQHPQKELFQIQQAIAPFFGTCEVK